MITLDSARQYKDFVVQTTDSLIKSLNDTKVDSQEENQKSTVSAQLVEQFFAKINEYTVSLLEKVPISKIVEPIEKVTSTTIVTPQLNNI